MSHDYGRTDFHIHPKPRAVGIGSDDLFGDLETNEMTLTQEQQQAMLEAAKPLIKWMNENCHPHCTAHVDQNNIELTEGIATNRTDEFLRD